MTVTESAAIAATVEQRIRDLLAYRAIARRNRWSAEWSPVRKANEVELRSLVGLVRKARRMAREAEGRDAVTAAKGYHDWQAAGPVTEPELIAGYGGGWPEGDSDTWTNREGMPEFNGAFR